MAKTYAEAGVDIDASDEATASLIAKIKGTNRKGNGEPIELVNGFAGLVKLDDKALAVCTDGVGTKILLAEEMNSLHTVGIDCVAMNVNDLIHKLLYHLKHLNNVLYKQFYLKLY